MLPLHADSLATPGPVAGSAATPGRWARAKGLPRHGSGSQSQSQPATPAEYRGVRAELSIAPTHRRSAFPSSGGGPGSVGSVGSAGSPPTRRARTRVVCPPTTPSPARFQPALEFGASSPLRFSLSPPQPDAPARLLKQAVLTPEDDCKLEYEYELRGRSHTSPPPRLMMEVPTPESAAPLLRSMPVYYPRRSIDPTTPPSSAADRPTPPTPYLHTPPVSLAAEPPSPAGSGWRECGARDGGSSESMRWARVHRGADSSDDEQLFARGGTDSPFETAAGAGDGGFGAGQVRTILDFTDGSPARRVSREQQSKSASQRTSHEQSPAGRPSYVASESSLGERRPSLGGRSATDEGNMPSAPMGSMSAPTTYSRRHRRATAEDYTMPVIPRFEMPTLPMTPHMVPTRRFSYPRPCSPPSTRPRSVPASLEASAAPSPRRGASPPPSRSYRKRPEEREGASAPGGRVLTDASGLLNVRSGVQGGGSPLRPPPLATMGSLAETKLLYTLAPSKAPKHASSGLHPHWATGSIISPFPRHAGTPGAGSELATPTTEGCLTAGRLSDLSCGTGRPSDPTSSSPVHSREAEEGLRLSDGNGGKGGGEFLFDEQFEYLHLLGTGSFSKVWRARNRSDGQEYAIKASKKLFRTRTERRLLLREAENSRTLGEHAHIVRYFRAWQDQRCLYLQLELCPGGTLRSHVVALAVESGKPLPDRRLWAYTAQLCSGLAHIHAHGLMHLDIKPENILVSHDGMLKIGDLGLAVTADEWEEQEGDAVYIAPELLRAQPSPSCDIFSLGLVLYELASLAELPRDAPSGSDAWHRIRGGELPFPNAPRRTPAMKELVVRCCAPEPADRPSASQIQRMAEERFAWHAHLEEEEEEREADSKEGGDEADFTEGGTSLLKDGGDVPRRMSAEDLLAVLVDDWAGGAPRTGCGSQGSDHSRLGREFANCQLGGGGGYLDEDAEMSSAE